MAAVLLDLRYGLKLREDCTLGKMLGETLGEALGEALLLLLPLPGGCAVGEVLGDALLLLLPSPGGCAVLPLLLTLP